MIAHIPPETIEEILLYCDPVDVAAFGQTSRFFRSLVYQETDQHLWRLLYLSQPFDDPRKCTSLNGIPRSYIDWKGELQRIIRARTVVDNPMVCRPDERNTILSTLLDMVCHVPPLVPTTFSPNQLSENLLWVALRGKNFLDHASGDDLQVSPGEQQQLARLHTYFGLTNMDLRPLRRVESRAFVYNMRNYREDNKFGPFMMDGSGRVNWLHVQALHHVVSMHIVNPDEEGEFFDFPMSLPFIQPVIPGGISSGQEIDWAGVVGSWTCSFCFCDHRELMVYNDAMTESELPDSALFEDPEFQEAFRSVQIQIRIIDIPPDYYPTRRRIRFVGETGDVSVMNGWVQMTPDDQINWNFVSGDQGIPIWSCEGIQVGGLGSAFGVLGSWTTIFHEEHDPIGPFWLRKNN